MSGGNPGEHLFTAHLEDMVQDILRGASLAAAVTLRDLHQPDLQTFRSSFRAHEPCLATPRQGSISYPRPERATRPRPISQLEAWKPRSAGSSYYTC